MKGKETRKNSRTVHDWAFKRRVIDDLLLTGDSLSGIGKHYGVTSRSIYNWLRIFGIIPPKNEIISTMVKEHKDRELQQENIELKREIARLKVALFHTEAEALAQKTLLKQVTTRYHIEVKRPICNGERAFTSSIVRGHKLSVLHLRNLMEVSRKGYYKHSFSQEDREVKVSSVLYSCQHIREAGTDVLLRYVNEYYQGAFQVGRDWLCKEFGANDMLLKSHKRKRLPRTTRGVVDHGFQDHLNTIPKYIAPDHCRLTVADITYVKYLEGFAYPSSTMDAYSRIITGFDL